jgi:hypothetical protein
VREDQKCPGENPAEGHATLLEAIGNAHGAHTGSPVSGARFQRSCTQNHCSG